MPKVFFLSYARPRSKQPDALKFVDQFERDLDSEVAQLLGNDGMRVGFRDSGNIEAGTHDWVADLTKQLKEHPIGIALISPTYLASDRSWCKWECLFLHARNRAVAALPESDLPSKPRLLLLVDWIKPNQADLPADFPDKEQRVGESIAADRIEDVPAVRAVLERGVRATLKLKMEGNDQVASTQYERFLQAFARYVVDQWKRWLAVADRGIELPDPPPFDVSDGWTTANPTNAAEPAKPRRDRRRKVFVVYVAAKPNEVADTRAWRYKEDGEYDWQPFAGLVPRDDEQHVGRWVRDLAELLDDIEIREWPFVYFKDNMPAALELAGRRYPLLIIVDPWTASQFRSYGQVLRRYASEEKKNGVFSVPVVIWNDCDPDHKACANDFEERVARLFDFNRWQRIRGRDHFSETLCQNVRLLQQNIRNARAEELPSSGSALPRLSANP